MKQLLLLQLNVKKERSKNVGDEEEYVYNLSLDNDFWCCKIDNNFLLKKPKLDQEEFMFILQSFVNLVIEEEDKVENYFIVQ